MIAYLFLSICLSQTRYQATPAERQTPVNANAIYIIQSLKLHYHAARILLLGLSIEHLALRAQAITLRH